MKNQISPGASVPDVQSPTNGSATGCDEAVRVGSTVWRHVERYHRPPGFKVEECFQPITITAETRVSWVAKEGWMEFKFPKKKGADESHKDPDTRLAKGRGGSSTRIYLTQRAVSDEVWGINNRDALKKHLDGLLSLIYRGGVAELRRIAALVGYEEADSRTHPSQPASEAVNATVPCGAEALAKSKASEPSADDSYDPDDGRV